MLVLALLLSRLLDDAKVQIWAESFPSYHSDNGASTVAAGSRFLHLKFAEFLKGTTLEERQAVVLAVAAFRERDPDGMSTEIVSADILKYVFLPFSTKSDVLLGPVAPSGKVSVKRRTQVAFFVARLINDKHELLRSIYASCAEQAIDESKHATRAAGLPPGRFVEGPSKEQMINQLADAEAKIERMKTANRVMKCRSSKSREVMRAAIAYRVSKATAEIEDAVVAERNAARALLKERFEGIGALKKWKKWREANADHKRVRQLESELAQLRNENFELRIATDKLEDELSTSRVQQAKNQGIVDNLWLPTRTSDDDNCRGGAHDYRFRLLAMNYLTRNVSPNQIPEIIATTARWSCRTLDSFGRFAPSSGH